VPTLTWRQHITEARRWIAVKLDLHFEKFWKTDLQLARSPKHPFYKELNSRLITISALYINQMTSFWQWRYPYYEFTRCGRWFCALSLTRSFQPTWRFQFRAPDGTDSNPYSHTLQDLRRPVQSSLTGNEPLYLWLAVELENRSNQNFRLISASLFEVFGTCRPIPVCVSGWSIYTMSWKRCHYRPILPLTLPNADRFSKFFHRQTAVNF